MKKIGFFIPFLLLHSYFCVAQSDMGANRTEAIRIAFITKELNLSPEEAQKFWPVYNDYIDELRQARQSYRDDELTFEETVVAVRKKYKPQFKKLLKADDRVNKTYLAERKFREILKKELDNRKRLRKAANNMNMGYQ
jgi:hypothetical protein